MTEILEVKETEVLEIGTGSGYQAAVLAELAARSTASSSGRPGAASPGGAGPLGYSNVQFRVGDGTLGWPEEAPFDGIIVTAGAPRSPGP